MPDTEQIDPTRDRVWAVDVTIHHTAYVIAETANEAERTAADQMDDDDLEADYDASELTEPLEPPDVDCRTVPFGTAHWDGRELTVNEAVELVASHKPAYDTQTLLMPFAGSPPPLRPARIEDYLAAGREAG